MKRALAVIGLSALLICGSAARATDQSAEAVLKAKGLTKVGVFYLLDADVNLRAGLRVMRQAGSQLDNSLAKRGEIERQLRDAREAELQLYSNNQDLHARMQKARDIPFRYNDLVAQANQVEGQIHRAELYIADREKALKAFSIPSEQYLGAVNDLSERMEITKKHYEALAADPDVAAALTKINAEAHFPVKLGPSVQFTTELASVRREHEKVRAAAIKFDLEGGVPVVHVTLNGTLPWKMVLDSGAAEVTLTFEVAQELGLMPEASDPTMRMRSADGKVTVARLKTLKSVKLGQFTVENVECVVLPEGVPGSNLLGATFLSRFVYQMDLNAGEVHLSQIGPTIKPKLNETTEPPASPTTSPTSRPVADTGEDQPPAGGAEWIDLLKAVNVTRDAITGKWVLADGILSVEAGPGIRKLQVPTEPSGAYEIHLEYERPDHSVGDGSLNLALPVGSDRVVLIVTSQAIGLDRINGERFTSNETTRKGDFRDGKKHQLDITVTPAAGDAKISVSLDGQLQFGWSGPSSALHPLGTWGNNPKGLCIAAWKSAHVITAFQLRNGAIDPKSKEPDDAQGKPPQ
jgi:aspartyl protease family protein